MCFDLLFDLLSWTPRNLLSDPLLAYLNFLGLSRPLGGQGPHNSKSVGKKVEIATDIAVIRIAAI